MAKAAKKDLVIEIPGGEAVTDTAKIEQIQHADITAPGEPETIPAADAVAAPAPRPGSEQTDSTQQQRDDAGKSDAIDALIDALICMTSEQQAAFRAAIGITTAQNSDSVVKSVLKTSATQSSGSNVRSEEPAPGYRGMRLTADGWVMGGQ